MKLLYIFQENFVNMVELSFFEFWVNNLKGIVTPLDAVLERHCTEANASDKAINNGSACSVLFLSTTGLFPARRKILEHETQSSALTYFLSARNYPGVLKNSTEHTEPLFITFRQFP